jgi:hypothetical protein
VFIAKMFGIATVHDYVGAVYTPRSIVTIAIFSKPAGADGELARHWYVCNNFISDDNEQSKTLIVLEEVRVPVIIQQLYALIKANGSRVVSNPADDSMSLRMPNIGASASDDTPEETTAYVSSYKGIGAFVAGLKVTSYDALQQKLTAFGKLFRLFGLPQNRIVLNVLLVAQSWRELARRKAELRRCAL